VEKQRLVFHRNPLPAVCFIYRSFRPEQFDGQIAHRPLRAVRTVVIEPFGQLRQHRLRVRPIGQFHVFSLHCGLAVGAEPAHYSLHGQIPDKRRADEFGGDQPAHGLSVGTIQRKSHSHLLYVDSQQLQTI